jgi:hypothetical protein
MKRVHLAEKPPSQGLLLRTEVRQAIERRSGNADWIEVLGTKRPRQEFVENFG